MSRPSNDRRRHAAPEEPRPSLRGRLLTAVVVALSITYGVLFFAAPVPELDNASRAALLENSLLLADEVAASWTGDPPQFAIADRLRVLLPAVALLGLCGLAGWLALCGLQAERGLSALESIFFWCAVGCSLVSLYTLLVGLAGGLHSRFLFLVPASRRRGWSVATLAQKSRGAKRNELTAAEQHGDDTCARWLWWVRRLSS